MLESERVAWRRKDTGAVKKWKEKSQPSYLQGSFRFGNNFLKRQENIMKRYTKSVFLAP